MTTDYRRYSNSQEEEEVVLDERSCFGFASTFLCLPLIAGLNFLMDIGAACLSIGSDFIFCFGILSIFSLLCLGATLSGTQEEHRGKIKLAMSWIIVKMILIVLLVISTLVAFIDLDWFTRTSKCNNFGLI